MKIYEKDKVLNINVVDESTTAAQVTTEKSSTGDTAVVKINGVEPGGGGSSPCTVLWTNSNPTAEFGAQNIDISTLDTYDYIEVRYFVVNTEYQLYSAFTMKETTASTSYTSILTHELSGSNKRGFRNYVNGSTKQVMFSDCTGGSLLNQSCVPYQIIGWKNS